MNYKINEEAAMVTATPDAVDGITTFGLFSQAKAQLVSLLKQKQKGYDVLIRNVRGMKEKEAHGPQG